MVFVRFYVICIVVMMSAYAVYDTARSLLDMLRYLIFG